jgi:hypothetical protein
LTVPLARRGQESCASRREFGTTTGMRHCRNALLGQLAEARVWANFIELTPELFDQDLRINPVFEPLHAQALVPELAVEGFVHPVQPGLAGINERGVSVLRLKTNSKAVAVATRADTRPTSTI